MHRTRRDLENQQGSVLLIALIILLLVSLLGLRTLSMTSTELKISGNDRNYTQNFYRAEAAAKEAAYFLETSDDPSPSNTDLPWLSDGSDSGSSFDPETDSWVTSGTDANARTSKFYGDGQSRISAVRLGVAPGSSLDMSRERKWEYIVYGRSELSSGQVDIAAGYLKKSD
ncbi:hypothetical protein DSLASN_08940 [Desulfoluna limicola]|uniref:Type 4 fimbrial biogenesis protein PilX N-terminal domain-containing protein n=1 Tax=Desulfoluna limicola TaxID=2810562 RepID=A0ABM7PDE5_9BACT|nr:PilX N-terminal domain-containing pilus assembly protein [Desulfoluna limicola]BCS95262.1 hypothetical protein DSLASN_08940 [Desulfoluna limicola]